MRHEVAKITAQCQSAPAVVTSLQTVLHAVVLSWFTVSLVRKHGSVGALHLCQYLHLSYY